MDNKTNENENIVFENQKITDVNIEKEVKKSFIEYSMSVIISRALPDVREISSALPLMKRLNILILEKRSCGKLHQKIWIPAL